jgi:hypothetical protein
MNQDKRHQQGTEFEKHQDQSGKSRQGEHATEQQSGQQPGGQQQGQRDRGEPGSKGGGPGAQRR